MARPCIDLAVLAVIVLVSISSSLALRNHENLKHLEEIEKYTTKGDNPCNNFYKYACGYYSGYNNVSTTAVQNFENELESIILEKYPYANVLPLRNQNFEQKVATYYYSCKNEKDLRYRTYMEYIDMVFPLVTQWKSDDFDGYFDDGKWAQYFNALSDLGKLYHFGVKNLPIDVSFENNGVVLKPGNIVPFEAADVHRYLRTLNVDSFMIANYVEEIIKLQEKYKLIIDLHSLNDGEASEPVGLEKLQIFISKAFALEERYETNAYFKVVNPEFFRNFLETPWPFEEKRIFKNMLMVTLMHHLESTLSSNCMQNVRGKFGLALNYMYYESRYLPMAQQRNDDLYEIIKAIMNSYIDVIQENHLEFTPEHVSQIKKYLLETYINVGNLPDNVNFNMVNQFYKPLLDLEIDNFFKSDLAVRGFRNSEVSLCKDEYRMICDSSITEPIYNKDLRVLAIPFTWLQAPLYDYNWDPVFKFSTLGYEVAKGLTYAVGPKMLESLDEYQLIDLSCFDVRDEVEDIPLDLYESQGVEIAVYAFRDIYSSQPDFTNIPAEKLFFRNLAQTFCTTGNKKTHALPKDFQRARLNALIKNMDTFNPIFKCSEGSRMVKTNYCRFY